MPRVQSSRLSIMFTIIFHARESNLRVLRALSNGTLRLNVNSPPPPPGGSDVRPSRRCVRPGENVGKVLRVKVTLPFLCSLLLTRLFHASNRVVTRGNRQKLLLSAHLSRIPRIKVRSDVCEQITDDLNKTRGKRARSFRRRRRRRPA